MTARRFDDLDVHEVLALALAVEKANSSRFTTLAELYEGYDDELHALLSELRDEEIRHTRLLAEEWNRRFGSKPRPDINENDVEGVIEAVDLQHGEHTIFDDLNREDVLLLVQQAEHDARDFYQKAAAQCSDPGLRALYLDLAAMEERHVEVVEGLTHDDDAED